MDLSKLLGTPFSLNLNTLDVDHFLYSKISKELDYWSAMKPFSASKVVIYNHVLLSTLWYFITVWGGSNKILPKIKNVIGNYLWFGKTQSPNFASLIQTGGGGSKSTASNYITNFGKELVINMLPNMTKVMDKWQGYIPPGKLQVLLVSGMGSCTLQQRSHIYVLHLAQGSCYNQWMKGLNCFGIHL